MQLGHKIWNFTEPPEVAMDQYCKGHPPMRWPAVVGLEPLCFKVVKCLAHMNASGIPTTGRNSLRLSTSQNVLSK